MSYTYTYIYIYIHIYLCIHSHLRSCPVAQVDHPETHAAAAGLSRNLARQRIQLW